MNIEEVIDTTILGITYHPDIRDLSDATKKDVAKMIRDLVVKLNIGQSEDAADRLKYVVCPNCGAIGKNLKIHSFFRIK